MALINIMPVRTYAPGIYNLGPEVLNSTLSSFSLVVDGSQLLDPALLIKCTIDFSWNGANWASSSPSQPTDPFPLRFTTEGNSKDRLGNPVNPTIASILPGAGLTTRQIKMQIELTGASATLGAQLTVN